MARNIMFYFVDNSLLFLTVK